MLCDMKGVAAVINLGSQQPEARHRVYSYKICWAIITAATPFMSHNVIVSSQF